MIDKLYKTWTQLGVGFLEQKGKTVPVDLEKSIVATAGVGRTDSRLLFGMRAWLLKHHDLVNNSRLIRLLPQEKESAVLGAIIDSILSQIPRSTLRYVRKYCKKAKEPEFVFTRIANSKVQSILNREENLSIWKKWNLISREMGEMHGAIMEKSFVYAHNRNLALRALFGPTSKADVWAFLLENKSSNVHQMAKSIGISYEPVYSELMTYKSMGLVKEEKQGLARVFTIKAIIRNRWSAILTTKT